MVLALGNPGIQYQATRHNAGYRVADRIVAEKAVGFKKPFFKAFSICRVVEDDSKLYLVKPLTYVNNSGRAASQALRSYRLPVSNLLVVCDNLDLAPGTCRLKRGGKDAGHNGLKSIISTIESGEFLRLYVGVGHPGRRESVVDWVLGKPDDEDNEKIESAVSRAAWAVGALLSQSTEQVMSELNRKR